MAVLEGVRPLRMIPPTETASNSNNVFDSDPSKVVSPPDNSTSWLPPGWEVFSRIKSSGASYKVYRESETGRKFYSRVEVLKYLQNSTQQNPSPRTPQQKVQAEPITIPGEHPNWLPPDWVVEIKTKMSGKTAGHRYKVFVEKSTGRKFYSQREALDYLKPSNSSTPEMKNVQSATSEDHPHWLPSGRSVQTETEGGSSTSERKDKMRDTEREETDVKGLPPGWFKAIRYRETHAGIRRKTTLYVDPKSRYAFFSTKDALRYINNGHIKLCRMRPTRWKEISEDITENKFHFLPTGERSELESQERKGKSPLFTEENYESKSEDVMMIGDSDEENGYKLEKKEKKPLFGEENGGKQSEDITETADSPIGAEKVGTAEKEKERTPEAQPLKKRRFKVLASKRRPLIRSSS